MACDNKTVQQKFCSEHFNIYLATKNLTIKDYINKFPTIKKFINKNY